MNLSGQHCQPLPQGTPPLSRDQLTRLLPQVPGWELDKTGKAIFRIFTFESYWEGLGFVNAVAWIAQQEKHHPDIELLYKKVRVLFTTHSVDGLSENDFICAARANAL
jgi:4a-hydroxytetrahydrobiopterin dehydratase